MKWSELRKRLDDAMQPAGVYDLRWAKIVSLLAAIDAAAPAMEEQELNAARFVATIQDIERREGVAAGARMILAADVFVQEQEGAETGGDMPFFANLPSGRFVAKDDASAPAMKRRQAIAEAAISWGISQGYSTRDQEYQRLKALVSETLTIEREERYVAAGGAIAAEREK